MPKNLKNSLECNKINIYTVKFRKQVTPRTSAVGNSGESREKLYKRNFLENFPNTNS